MRAAKGTEMKYRGIFHTLKTVVKEEGFLALYKGNGANVARVIPNYSLKFMFNDIINNLVIKPGQERSTMTFQQMLGAGTLAGLSQMSITYPLETVRTRLTLSLSLAGGTAYRGIIDCFRQTIRSEGFFALYKGFGVATLSGAPYVGIQMSVYSFLSHQILPVRPDGSNAVQWKLVAGATAGVMAQSMMYWGDTLRRRMQTNGIGGEKKIYSSTWNCASIIMKNEGIRGSYRGLWANTLKAFPLAGLQFVFFDMIKHALMVK